MGRKSKSGGQLFGKDTNHESEGRKIDRFIKILCSSLCIIVSFTVIPFSHADELADIRAAIKEKGLRWIAAETPVSKLTPLERKMRLGRKMPLARIGEALTVSTTAALEAAPSGSFDWRNVGDTHLNFVTPVKDQGYCGSCWAFATAAAAESYWLIFENMPWDSWELDLSEQTLVSCSGAGDCMEGGFIDEASDYIQAYGLPVESCFPYTASDTSCGNACDGYLTDTYPIQDWSRVAASTEDIKNALYTYGPLVTTMEVYTDFSYYTSGIYEYSYGGLEGGHAILIVGYDDENSCFIVKNSWGTEWGESGYFRIAYSEMESRVYFGQDTMVYTECSRTATISPSSYSFDDIGGAGMVSVAADGGCEWRAKSNDDWIHITSGAAGTGTGTVNYSVDPNEIMEPRAGTITIAGKTFTIEQEKMRILSGLSISGPDAVNENASSAYAATASFEDGSTAAVTPAWDEDSPYAVIAGSGTLTTTAVTSNQTATITAGYTHGSVTKTATKSITIVDSEKVLVSLGISGPDAVNEYDTASYTATATFDDASTETVAPAWSESSPYASIDGSGTLTPTPVPGNQTVTVTAGYTYGSATRTATKAVTIVDQGKILSRLSISGAKSVNENSSTTYTASATFDDGSTAAVIPVWDEDSPFASINGSGMLTTTSVTDNEPVTITASYTYESVTKTATRLVAIINSDKILSGITISGADAVNENSSTAYTVTASFEDGSTASATPVWSEDSSHATIDGGGTLAAAAVTANETFTITAVYTYGSVTKTATRAVTIVNTGKMLSEITISGADSVDENGAAAYTATAAFDDGSTASATPVWSEDSPYASIDGGGTLNAAAVTANETFTITAAYTYGSVTKTATRTVSIVNTGKTLLGITISGADSVDENSTAAYTATATFDDGSTESATPVWSEDSPYASIDGGGTLTAAAVTANETFTITAAYTYGSVTKTATRTVTIVNAKTDASTSGDDGGGGCFIDMLTGGIQ